VKTTKKEKLGIKNARNREVKPELCGRKISGRHEETRTPDLYRVKVAL